MPATFAGIQIAKSGLFMAQNQLNVTGHNISNANTAGYTRQRIVQQNISPKWSPSFIAQNREAVLVGQGVELNSLDQIRDPYLDMRYRESNPEANCQSIRTTELNYFTLQFQVTTKDTNKVDLASQFGAFKNSVMIFANTTEPNLEMRTNVRDSAIAMCETFHALHNYFLETQMQQNDGISTCVDEVNRIADSIAKLNKEIKMYELSDQKALDLRDHRNLLIDELSNYVDLEYNYDETDRLTITVGGETLVDYDESFHMAIEEDAFEDEITGQSLCKVVWEDGGDVEITSGEIYGRLSIRDGIDPQEIGVPYVVDELNKMARVIAETFNEIHAQGFTQEDLPNGVLSTDGVNFFAGSDDYDAVNAGNLWLDQSILDSVLNIVASDVMINTETDATGSTQVGNNIISNQLYALLNEGAVMDDSQTFENHLKAMINTIAMQSKHANDSFAIEFNVVNNVTTSRSSYSGVSLDEEMTNMIMFQHAYKAASRMITTHDESLDKLINGTGRVGL